MKWPPKAGAPRPPAASRGSKHCLVHRLALRLALATARESTQGQTAAAALVTQSHSLEVCLGAAQTLKCPERGRRSLQPAAEVQPRPVPLRSAHKATLRRFAYRQSALAIVALTEQLQRVRAHRIVRKTDARWRRRASGLKIAAGLVPCKVTHLALPRAAVGVVRCRQRTLRLARARTPSCGRHRSTVSALLDATSGVSD